MDEILWCDHSNETSSAVLLHGTICFSVFHKMKMWDFLLDDFDLWHSWGLKGKKRGLTKNNLELCLRKAIFWAFYTII